MDTLDIDALAAPVTHDLAWGMYALPNSQEIHLFWHALEGDRSHAHDIFLLHPFDAGFHQRPLNIPFQHHVVIDAQKAEKLSFTQKETWPALHPKGSTTKERYIAQVHAALEKLDNIHQKLMVARQKAFPSPSFQPFTQFLKLRQKYPHTFTWFLSAPFAGTWLGASPELLLESAQGEVKTVALAGTRPAQDKDAPWGEKEIKEQALVTEHIQSVMSYLEIQDTQAQGPETYTIGHVAHLKTTLSGTMDMPDPEKLRRLMGELHPTPAVGGTPKTWAMDAIKEIEETLRTYYAGYMGIWNHQESRCSIYVNLRCLSWDGETAYIYAGAGITKDSVPEAEYQETEEKIKLLADLLFSE
jgi:isochorismate synthase